MKNMIIVGGGVSGLSAGCYAAMNGYDVEVFEMHTLPGGVCTSWKRKGFLFDHCLHWVIGSSAGNVLYPLFEELGVTEGTEFYHTDRFRRIRCGSHDVVIYTDIDRLEAELTSHFPAERKSLRRMMRLVRKYTRFNPPLDADFGSFGFVDILKMLPFMPSFLYLKGLTVREYISRFEDGDLRDVLFRMFPVPDMPALMTVMPLAFFHNRQGGYPMGGSLRLAEAVAGKLERLGGAIRYSRKIRKIVVEDGAAVGVETEDGELHRADIVVAACDGRTVLQDLLGGRYTPEAWRKMFDKPHLWPPIVCVSLGVNRDLTGEVELQSFRLDTPVVIAGAPQDWINWCHYCHDPAFAPPGKSVIALQFETDYAYWKRLYADRDAYEKEKRDILVKLTAALETALPGVTDQIEAADVATPMTWERYTGNWMGSYQGWLPVKALFGVYLPRTLPGLRNFYITGQWTFPGGGVPMCFSQARRLVKELCARDGIAFGTR